MSKIVGWATLVGFVVSLTGLVLYIIAIKQQPENTSLALVSFVVFSLSAVEAILGLVWWVFAKLSELIVSRLAPNNPGLRMLLYIVAVPILMGMMCVVFGYVFFYSKYMISKAKYGASFNTINEDSQVFPGNPQTSPSGLYIAEVSVNKATETFTVNINGDFGSSYTDPSNFHTDFLNEGNIEWIAEVDVLSLEAVEGEYLYYPTEAGWKKVSQKPKTTSECAATKKELKEFKGSFYDASFFVSCPAD